MPSGIDLLCCSLVVRKELSTKKWVLSNKPINILNPIYIPNNSRKSFYIHFYNASSIRGCDTIPDASIFIPADHTFLDSGLDDGGLYPRYFDKGVVLAVSRRQFTFKRVQKEDQMVFHMFSYVN